MAELGCQVVAFDYSMSEIQGLRAGRNLMEYDTSLYFHIVRGDWNHLPFKRGTFDVVFCFQSLHHSPTLNGLLCSIHSILKQKGRLISIGDPTMPLLTFNRQTYAERHQSIQMQNELYDNFYSARRYIRAFRHAGFLIQSIQPTFDLLRSKRMGILSKTVIRSVPDQHIEKANELLKPFLTHLLPQTITIAAEKSQ